MVSPKPHVLVTEDDIDTRDLIIFLLKEGGYDVTCSVNGAEALELARTGSFDLYLLDSWLPGLSGASLTRKLREFDSTTPILFYSAAAYESDIEDARLAGAQSYLVKPTTGEHLIGEIDRLISEARLQHRYFTQNN